MKPASPTPLALVVIAAAGCITGAPAPPAPAARNLPGSLGARVPAGCAQPLGGEWTHAVDPTWRYRADDDGGTLVLWPRRAISPPDGDAGESPPSPTDDGGTRIVLHRTPYGFLGVAHARAFTPAGHACPVEFPTEVLACSDGGLLLRSAASTAIDDQCRVPKGGPVGPQVEQPLTR